MALSINEINPIDFANFIRDAKAQYERECKEPLLLCERIAVLRLLATYASQEVFPIERNGIAGENTKRRQGYMHQCGF